MNIQMKIVFFLFAVFAVYEAAGVVTKCFRQNSFSAFPKNAIKKTKEWECLKNSSNCVHLVGCLFKNDESDDERYARCHDMGEEGCSNEKKADIRMCVWADQLEKFCENKGFGCDQCNLCDTDLCNKENLPTSNEKNEKSAAIGIGPSMEIVVAFLVAFALLMMVIGIASFGGI